MNMYTRMRSMFSAVFHVHVAQRSRAVTTLPYPYEMRGGSYMTIIRGDYLD